MIYCVEDDGDIRELIIYTLENTGMQARGFSGGAAFLEAVEEKVPDLVLMDIMLPGLSGVDLLKTLRASERTAGVPVIMLTARSSEYDKVLSLDLGADDYVTKPFGMMELLSRIRAVLRRSRRKADDQPVLTLAGIRIDQQQHTVQVDGEPAVLTLKEYQLLRELLVNRGAVLTRDYLLEKVWGYDFNGETRTVDVHIRNLRSKLGKAGDLIETVRGVGYRAADGNRGQ